jgi:hypothetical protein
MRKATPVLLFFLTFLTFFSFLPKSEASVTFPIFPLPFPDLTLYYSIEGEGIIQNVNPLLPFSIGTPITLPIDMLKVWFPPDSNESNGKIEYELHYFGTSTTVKGSLEQLSRLCEDGRFCPFYIKCAGLPNFIGLEFDWVYDYGGVKYLEWNGHWIKTYLYHYSYQDGSTTYSFRFYYEHSSLVLVRLEEETTINMVQTQFLCYTLVVGNMLFLMETNLVGNLNWMTNYVISGTISAILAAIFGLYIMKKKFKKYL